MATTMSSAAVAVSRVGRGSGYDPPVEPARFPIRFGSRSRPLLRLWTATPGTAYAEIGDDLLIRFGRYRFRTPLANVERYRIEGPFTWIKAIGVRTSVLGDHDVSFCGSAHGAVRIDLREPVKWGPIRVPYVWAGADDLEGLAAELARRGIPGEDGRRS
jgi:hypothetical protein